MIYKISVERPVIAGKINLVSSKSESNRALMIQALCKKKFEIHNLSEADDTQLLQSILNSNKKTHDCENAGTVLRFLTAFYAIQEGKTTVLTGTARLKERPIGKLVDMLRKLGAQINYLGKTGFAPIEIQGRNLKGGYLEADASVSSQFISAILLIAPLLPHGLILELHGTIASKPYIQMTLGLMQHLGIQSKWEGNMIRIQPQSFIAKDYTVENDWSAASYWYEMAALAEKVDLTIYGLRKESLQGDSIVAGIFTDFGIKTTYSKDKIHLSKSTERTHNYINTAYPNEVTHFTYDFVNHPDLTQTIAITTSALSMTGTFSRVKNLRIKESDRIQTLRTELKKLGIKLKEVDLGSEIDEHDDLSIEIAASEMKQTDDPVVIETHNDHRIAMAFAPLALKLGSILIENPNVVKKSYPRFWEDLKSIGFEVKAMKAIVNV
jgi:3-phosphoshikimate 1-carboxyvinyltransferase